MRAGEGLSGGVRYTSVMGQKRALVVDDSKSARVILSRMLEKYDIEVDMAESAEQAIEYLKHDRPDAIFMDHLMPGMDGLQAVQAIKSNPQTAMIPIMMYTSQEGELYVGQARALGAMGVLPKQVRPVDVSKVLYELHLLPDRRDVAEPGLVPVEIGAGGAVESRSQGAPAAADLGKRIEAMIKQQSVDLRRFVVASLDSLAARLEADQLRPVPASGPPPEPIPPPLPRQPVWPWILAVLSLCVLAAMGAMLWLSRQDSEDTHAQLAALEAANADLKQANDHITDSLKELSASIAASNAAASIVQAPGVAGTTEPGTAAPAAPASNLTRTESVPYGELPFDHNRTEVLRDILAKLEARGFHGVVKVTSSPGTFCLSGNASDGFLPAAPSLPASKCDLVGNPFEDSLSGQQQQSIAFANLIAGVRQRTNGAITVVAENAATPRNAMPYPARSDSLTAGDWNRAAAANNRVDFAAEPSAAP
jgi:CheY-like chemotaxis protein